MKKIIASLGVYALLVFSNVTALERRSTNDDDVTDESCEKFHGISSWTQEFVDSICSDAGRTNKGSTAVLCSPDAGKIEYESSLKLAILNSMYGKSASGHCRQWCMYDPLHIEGDDAVGFKWSGSGCWRVLRGATNNLCYKRARSEWMWAMTKAGNMCEDSPDCHVFQGIASWTPEYVEAICSDAGMTDKSTTAVLCSPHAGNVDYETSLKLAILNKMYGTNTIPLGGKCPYQCMYDPLHVKGSDAVNFRWSNAKQCWRVNVGSTSQLCNIRSLGEWSWAIAKTENWCLASSTGV
jgi:hypothetical protein